MRNVKEVLRFKTEIIDELENIGRIVNIIIKRRKDIKKAGIDSEVYLDSLVHNIENFYMGVEEVFKRIALFTDEGIPDGPRWHSILIKNMARDIYRIRPRVIQDETMLLLDEYRKFRHLVRNIYTFNIVPEKVMKLARDIKKAFRFLKIDINNFLKIIEKISE